MPPFTPANGHERSKACRRETFIVAVCGERLNGVHVGATSGFATSGVLKAAANLIY